MSDTQVTVSRDYVIRRPKNDDAIPVPCREWADLREDIVYLSTEPWLNQSLGSLFMGLALGTVVSIMTGAIQASTSTPNSIVAAWAVTITCLIAGVAFLYAAHKDRGVFRSRADAIAKQMNRIEERYEHDE